MKTTLKGSHLMIVCVLPHGHPLNSAEFPLHSSVVRNGEDRGDTRDEDIQANIADVTLGDLHRKFLEAGAKITWIARKPGERNDRLYVFLSRYNKPLELTPAAQASVDALMAQTWGWGRIEKKHNQKTQDLITIEVVAASGKKQPKHSFDFADESVTLAGVAPKQKTQGQQSGGNRRHARR